MPAGANSRTPAKDFVQDYAAKRQAQMERARQLPTAAPTSRQPPPPSLNMPRSRHVTPGHGSADSGSSPGKCGDGCVLYIKEQDFKQATQAGIITPDQARQLWAMLSNQIIRVCSPSAHANAVSVSSLLALSNNSYNSSGRAAGGPQSTGGSEFGASISLESLRTSIASGAAALKKPRTGRTSTVRPAVKGPAASSSPAAGASGVFGTSAQGGVGQGGGGYGNDDEEASNNMYMPPQPSSAVPRGAKASGSGAASRRPPASRLTAPPPSTGGNDAIAAEAAAVAQEPMQECRTCGRRFRISVVMRHEALCRNQANKPRKVFNMREQRLEATGAAKGKLPKWKVQHEQFQAAMRAVRQQKEAGGGFGFGQMAPPPAPIPEEYDDRVPCPHCGRKFAQEVAARHIPKCATTIAKPKGIRPIRR
ncbi:zinc-finger of a C2HC-type family protein [Leishmania donovani]|uniref:Zinc-finger of a C2HC-type family protein n=1 Tax=Leishmania donovani TaxID=5661 RepID=A0A504X6Z6_LEIDO|nr:zinc-finger of a C2HC-type family protein [Leishmania donovani]